MLNIRCQASRTVSLGCVFLTSNEKMAFAVSTIVERIVQRGPNI